MHTLEDFKKEMWLDEERGRFFWHKPGKGRRPGLQVGAFDVHGYGQINFKKQLYKEHRLVWLFITGEWPKGQIDHLNHDRRDNRFENLREVTNQENHFNRPLQKTNKSGVPGVWLDERMGKYRAFINVNGKRFELGFFEEKEAAIAARQEANREHGFHENHGIGLGRPKYKRYQRHAQELKKELA